MTLLLRSLIVLVLLIPAPLYAAVVINEIAWMGSSQSANDEWVELHNTAGESVTVDEWMLVDGVSLEVHLAGTIGAGEYAVLERTDDSSAPGIAFLIYTGALGNDGRTLSLKRADGSLEDTVTGGENWQNLGGDNETKDTAQRASSGWITARPTPGRANENAGTEEVLDTPKVNAKTNKNKDDDDSNGVISLTLPDNELSLSIHAPRVAYVNQKIDFVVEPRGLAARIMDSLAYTWNFGDAYGGEGKEVTHVYKHPGTYVVVVGGEHSRHEALTRHEITILPIELSMGRTDHGDVEIHNGTEYEVDLSGFVVRGDRGLTIPVHTVLLPDASLVIDAERVERGPGKMIALYDSRGTMVASNVPGSSDPEFLESITPPLVSDEIPIEYDTTEATTDVPTESMYKAEIAPPPTIHDGESISVSSAQGAAVITSGSRFASKKLYYLALAGVIVIAVLALYVRPKEGGQIDS